MRNAILKIAQEAHMMGRIYSQMGEPQTPAEVVTMLEEMVDKEWGVTPPEPADSGDTKQWFPVITSIIGNDFDYPI